MICLEGQVSLFDETVTSYFGQISLVPAIKVTAGKRKKIKDEVKCTYLEKGERIQSLLKKKVENNFKPNSFMDSFNFSKYPSNLGDRYAFLHRGSIRYFKSIITNSANLVEAMKPIKMTVEDLEKDSEFDSLLAYICRKSKLTYDGGIKATFKENVCYMPKKMGVMAEAKSGYMYKFKNHNALSVTCVDGIYYFFPVLLLLTLKQVITQLAITPKTPIYEALIEYQCDCISRYKSSGIVRISKILAENSLVLKFLEDHQFAYEFTTNSTDLDYRDFTVLFLLNYLPLDYLDLSTKRAYLGRRNAYVSLCGGLDYNALLLCFEKVFNDYIIQKREEEYKRVRSSDYAKSFMTKKNISQKVLSAMEKSKWNNYFGYVEFDSDCDIELVEKLQEEFKQLADRFNLEKQETVSLRFRRLGHHKAAGLYFPQADCICIDISNPCSLFHEYFHMLDYHNDSLSKKASFMKVYLRYKELLKEYSLFNEIPSGKYDLYYYLTHTEVFARCGEIFLHRILGIESSVLKPPIESFAYPKDEKLEKFIQEYYSKLLKV